MTLKTLKTLDWSYWSWLHGKLCAGFLHPHSGSQMTRHGLGMALEWPWNRLHPGGMTVSRCCDALRFTTGLLITVSPAMDVWLEAQCIIGGFGGHAAACFISCLAMLHASSCIFMHLRAAWNDLNIKSMVQLVSTSPVPTNAAYLSMPMLQGYA